MKLSLSILVADVYYLLFFLVTLPYWVLKFLTSQKYRTGFLQRLGLVVPREGNRPCVWLHGVSVGEILAARELIRLMREKRPEIEIVLSVTTKTGFGVAKKNYPDVSKIFFFPMDISMFVSRTMRRIRPDLIVMVELELWPNFFLCARRRGVPVAFVNGRITRRSFEGYRMIGWILDQVLPACEVVAVQNRLYGERLVLLGAGGDRVKVTGNMKYDNISTAPDAEFAGRLRSDLGIGAGERVIIGGSIHPGEDETLLAVYSALKDRFADLRLVLVPRHPEQFDRAERLARSRGMDVVRRTAGPATSSAGRPVVLLDTVGELGAAYALAEIIFVGGSLVPHGGQNMLEPAGLGKAVMFGKHTFNFKTDVDLLLSNGAAIEVGSAEELQRNFEALLSDMQRTAELGRRARDVIVSQKGASARNFFLLEGVFLAPDAPCSISRGKRG